MSEHSSSFKLLSQSQQNGGDTSLDSEGVSIVPCGLTQAMEYAESKPRCVDFAISHFEVCIDTLSQHQWLLRKIAAPSLGFSICHSNYRASDSQDFLGLHEEF